MADFQYQSYDRSAIKVAFQNLRQKEQKGFWYGLISLPVGYIMYSKLRPSFRLGTGSAVFIPLLTGSLVYGMCTFNARNQYQSVAAQANRKYSNVINRAINGN